MSSGPSSTSTARTSPSTEGETLYEVAERRNERRVPTLCYDERLEAFGACRLCVVELEGSAQPGRLLHDAGDRPGWWCAREPRPSSATARR